MLVSVRAWHSDRFDHFSHLGKKPPTSLTLDLKQKCRWNHCIDNNGITGRKTDLVCFSFLQFTLFMWILSNQKRYWMKSGHLNDQRLLKCYMVNIFEWFCIKSESFPGTGPNPDQTRDQTLRQHSSQKKNKDQALPYASCVRARVRSDTNQNVCKECERHRRRVSDTFLHPAWFSPTAAPGCRQPPAAV